MKSILPVSRLYLLNSLLLLLLVACSDSNNSPSRVDSRPQPQNPAIEGPVTTGGGPECCFIRLGGLVIDLRDLGVVPGDPFYAERAFDLADVGYQEKEYFISGIASSYVNTDTLGEDGKWPVMEAEGAEYTSRIVVQRPIDPADFNGTVVVEWFNVTSGGDAAPDWLQMHTELHREGYAWVGVSAQLVGVEGGSVFPLGLKQIDRERYGPLQHPGDSFSYDIFSQAAQAVRRPVGLDPLEGLQVERMIAVGQSQAAFRLVTYYNAINPLLDIFDGYIIHSRGASSGPVSQAPQIDVPAPGRVYLREDQQEPVIMLQTETDLFGGGLRYLAARQPDSASIRLWEVAGSAHSDAYTSLKGASDEGNDPAIAEVISTTTAREPFIECPLPINDGPGHWVAKAAVSAMERWIAGEADAPRATRLQVNGNQSGFELDQYDNALGGIRTPYVDAPVATLSGLGQEGDVFCDLFGTTELFTDQELSVLYPSRQAYIDAIDRTTDAAVASGFLLPKDADLIKSQARMGD